MKTKVEVITLQRVPNYGSVLQGYATQKVIEKLGYEVELINYYPQRMHMFAMLKRLKYKNDKLRKSLGLRTIARLVIIPSYIKRFRVFNKFTKEHIKMTDKQYITFEDLKNDIPKADIYCTGSDQVWNSKWNEGIDYSLFLDFLPENKKRITYAASFGKAELEDFEIDETRKMLKRYDAISVREKSGVDIIRKLGIENVTNVVDPTLLLNGDDWRRLSSNKHKDEKYILVYNLNRNKKIDNYAKKLSKETGLKIYYLSYQLHELYKTGKMFCNPNVEDFISLIDNAQYVITDSFHATAFSLNLNTQFVIVYPKKYSTRLQSILELLELENRVAKDEDDMGVVEKNIDFEKVNKKIESMRMESLEWLNNALKGDE